MWLVPAAALIVAASSVTSDPLVDWLSRAGAFGILVLAVTGFLRGWIVPGKDLERERAEHEKTAGLLREERDRALDLVYRAAELNQRLTTLVEKKG